MTHSAKNSADNLAQNTRNSPKFIRSTCPIGLKVLDTIEKRPHRASVVRALKSRQAVESCRKKRQCKLEIGSLPTGHPTFLSFL